MTVDHSDKRRRYHRNVSIHAAMTMKERETSNSRATTPSVSPRIPMPASSRHKPTVEYSNKIAHLIGAPCMSRPVNEPQDKSGLIRKLEGRLHQQNYDDWDKKLKGPSSKTRAANPNHESFLSRIEKKSDFLDALNQRFSNLLFKNNNSGQTSDNVSISDE